MSSAAGPQQTGIRLIASDLDGTILSHDFTISERTVEAFGRARAAGYEVVFVTGRPPWFMKPLVTYMGAAGHKIGRVIGSNGAVVYDLENEEILETDLLPAELAALSLEGIRERVPEAVFAVETVGGPVAEEAFLFPGYKGYHVVDSVEEFLRNPPLDGPFAGTGQGVLKLHARVVGGTDPDAFAALAAPGVPEGAHLTHSVAGHSLIEVSKDGVTKAKTLAAYASELGIEADQVLTFGDMPNDVQMLGWSGTGFAMASGHPLTIEAADRIAPAFAEDGVAQVLEELLETGRVPEGVAAP